MDYTTKLPNTRLLSFKPRSFGGTEYGKRNQGLWNRTDLNHRHICRHFSESVRLQSDQPEMDKFELKILAIHTLLFLKVSN